MKQHTIFRKMNVLLLLLMLSLLMTSCKDHDYIYSLANEEYLIGWVLHNINDSTPTDITFTQEDVETHNVSFNYPGGSPYTYDNVFFFFAPGQWIAAAGWTEIYVPLNRMYYLMNNNPVSEKYSTDFRFENYMYINMMDEYWNYGYDAAQKEYLTNGYLTPQAGEEKHITVGTSPFKPASVYVDNNYIELTDRLLRGQNGNSYLSKDTTFTDDDENAVTILVPTYKVYKDNSLVDEGNLTNYNGIWDYSYISY
ncbi:MAG: hypothetical protein KKF89_05710, partial [Nanoarchaeota archaeon]|nr:hypothetical protein [Nanoarchaeota archaeon]